MPLQKQRIQIPFAQGVDEKTTDKFVSPGKLLKLQNGSFRKLGSISKSYGYKRLGAATAARSQYPELVGGNLGVLASIRDLYAHKNELCLLKGVGSVVDSDNHAFFSYAEQSKTWTEKGRLYPFSVSVDNAVKAQQGFAVPAARDGALENVGQDIAIKNNFVLMSWRNKDGIFASVMDLNTGSYVVDAFRIESDPIASTATAFSVRCVAVGDFLCVVYGIAAGSLKLRAINTTTINSGFAAAVTLKADLDAIAIFDCTSNGTTGYCVYRKAGAPDVISTFSFSNTAVIATAADLSALALGLAIVIAGTTVFVAYTLVNGTVRTFGKDDSGGAMAAGYADVLLMTFPGAPADVTRVCGIATSSSTVRFFASQIGTAITQTDRVSARHAEITSGGAPGAEAVLMRSVILASKPFSFGGALFLFVTYTNEGAQGDYFVLMFDPNAPPSGSTITGRVCGRPMSGAGPISRTGVGRFYGGKAPPSVLTLDDGIFLGHLTITQADFGSPDGVSSELYDTRTCRIDFNQRNIGSVSDADGLLIPGGVLYQYDGESIYEHGFLVFPYVRDAEVTSPPAGSVLGAGTYGIAVTYAWFDANGTFHESAPSPTVSHAVAAGDQIDVIVPTCRVTSKNADKIKILIYRTLANLSTLYLEEITDNDPTVDTITVTLDRASVELNKILYTNGGILENIAPPASSIIASRSDRIFLATEKNRVFYSKVRIPGEAIEMNDSLFVDFPLDYGNLTAMCIVDGRLIAFAERGIFYLDGDGANNLGLGVFSNPRDILSPVGAMRGTPVFVTGNGAFFQSGRGIEMLTRDMRVLFVGAPVENLTAGKTLSAVMRNDKDSEIYFTFVGGPVVIYNEFFQQWSHVDHGPTQTPTSSAAWNRNGTLVHALSNTQSVWEHVSGQFYDLGAATKTYPMAVDTAWIKVADIQGFQRVYEIAILGQFKGKHDFQVDLFYDYVDTVAETKKVTVINDLNPQQFTLQPKRQKCQAIRMRITETDPFPGNEGFTLDHWALEVGIKSGINKGLGKAKTL